MSAEEVYAVRRLCLRVVSVAEGIWSERGHSLSVPRKRKAPDPSHPRWQELHHSPRHTAFQDTSMHSLPDNNVSLRYTGPTHANTSLRGRHLNHLDNDLLALSFVRLLKTSASDPRAHPPCPHHCSDTDAARLSGRWASQASCQACSPAPVDPPTAAYLYVGRPARHRPT